MISRAMCFSFPLLYFSDYCLQMIIICKHYKKTDFEVIFNKLISRSMVKTTIFKNFIRICHTLLLLLEHSYKFLAIS